MQPYPVYLVNLEQQRVVIFGGNAEAAAEVRTLRASGAGRIIVIAQVLCPELAVLIEKPHIRHEARSYRPGDLRNTLLAIATERDSGLNAWIAGEALVRGVVFSALDNATHCALRGTATLGRDDQRTTTGTGGASPTRAVRYGSAS